MKRGFTLIELMVTVSVLAVGLVLVLHSRLGILSALDSGENQIKALQFLEGKMNEIEQSAKEDGGVTEQQAREEIMLGARRATWTLETAPVEMPLPEGEEGEAAQEEEESLLEVIMRLTWQEKGKEKKMAMVTFFPEAEKE